MPVMIIEVPENPERTGDMIAADVSGLECYKAVCQIFSKLKSDLDQIIAKIREWMTDYTRELDMNSFMVCRCGGLLTFESNGQEFRKYFSALYLRTTELVEAIKNHYLPLEAAERVLGEPEKKYELKYAYRHVLNSMDKAYKFLTEGSTGDGTMYCNVHFEFVAKSVREQEKMFLSALFTVAGFMPGTGTICGYISALMAVYDVGQKVIGFFSDKSEEQINLKDIVSDTGEIMKDLNSFVAGGEPLIKKAYEEAGKTIPEMFEDALNVNSNISKVLGAFALMTVMNYDLTDNWVESIRVYIFTEEYMFYVEQFLNEACAKDGDPIFYMTLDRKEYINSRRGSNVAWGEDPGITYDAKTIFSEKPMQQIPEDCADFFNGVLESDVYDK
ncbi:hypothetical protein D3Z50_12095 [Clostridiaceae bacterium]|jgi:hypothetical protein|nr:hypothetical protein [Clostridiaceae bacterium]